MAYYFETSYDKTGISRLSSAEYDLYKDKLLQLKLSVLQGCAGTLIQEIQAIEQVQTIQNK